ncbi:MAG TPA: undecaprenyldiphospho-muramoylpentapeptide beta-N-acetylglucosaminyltransferase [Mycobacteriales bacterium]|nr:undecaprenyldiphospho-muramoylpentapeptide beta-N-acetylglucosaminyltransferase [Mycobacteriales bacterium]
MRVLLAGGGTAGHVEPALATAAALQRMRGDVEIVMLGTERGLETRLVPAQGYELALIPPVPLPRRVGADLAAVPWRLRRAVAAARAVQDRVQPAVVLGFGGYVALPAYLAARRRIPIVVHEANGRPGLANRVGARLAARVAVASPGIRLPGAVPVGMPLRRAIAVLDRPAARAAARRRWGLREDGPVLLVFGGSQGARRLNQAAVAAAPRLRDAGIEVLHATGSANHEEVTAGLAEVGVGDGWVTAPYIEDMAAAYAAADLAVCRAGAMTVAELTAVGLPAVYVPLPIGNGEQRLNAAPVVAAGGGVMVDDAQLSSDRLAAEVLPLLSDPAATAGMSAAAAAFGRRDADEALARLVLDAATE